jgi:hypothetical protein
MQDTTYATGAEFKTRIHAKDTEGDTVLYQALVNAGAYLVDWCTRMPPRGTEAFSATGTAEAPVTRLFDDDLSGIVRLDDCLQVISVTRNGQAVDPSYYQLWPYNELPRTQLYFRIDLILPTTLAGGWYGYPYRDQGPGQIAVSGVWGFCAAADRPPIIKEATLMQAQSLYQRIGLNPSALLQALQNPSRALDPRVELLLFPVKKGPRV